MSDAMWLDWMVELSPSVLRDVNVPGKITKPASRIHVKKEARMLCRRGMVSRPRSMFMYRVCTLSWRFGAEGRLGEEAEALLVVPEACPWRKGM
jgi:hypothetical protein